MNVPLYGVLLLFLFLGATASLISQIATARQGLQARVLANTLRRNYERLRERNITRRTRLREREKKLEELRDKKIANVSNQYDADALQEAIDEQAKAIENVRKTIADSEVIITGFDKRIEDVELQRAQSHKSLIIVSTCVGGATATIFGFLNYLTGAAALNSIASPVPVTSSVIVQSLALGAGWPLVWEKLQSGVNLEEAVNINSEFESSVSAAEKDEV